MLRHFNETHMTWRAFRDAIIHEERVALKGVVDIPGQEAWLVEGMTRDGAKLHRDPINYLYSVRCRKS